MFGSQCLQNIFLFGWTIPLIKVNTFCLVRQPLKDFSDIRNMCVLNVFGINKYYSVILFSLMWLTCSLIVEMYYPIGFEWSLCGIPLLIKGATGHDRCVFVLKVVLCVRPAQSGFNKDYLFYLYPSNHTSAWNILKWFNKESGTNILYMHTSANITVRHLKSS